MRWTGVACIGFIIFAAGCFRGSESSGQPVNVHHLIDPDRSAPIWDGSAGNGAPIHLKNLTSPRGVVRAYRDGVWRRAFVVSRNRNATTRIRPTTGGTLRFWASWSSRHGHPLPKSPGMTIRIDRSPRNQHTETSDEHQVKLSRWSGHWQMIDIPLPDSQKTGELTFILDQEMELTETQDVTLLVGSPMIVSGETTQKPHVIWIVLDSMRARDAGMYGSPEITTPFLDTLSRQAVTCSALRSSSSWTMPSVKNYMTGRYTNRFVREGENLYKIKPRLPLIQSVFAQNGWLTAAVTANHLITADTGYDRGFTEFDDAPAEHWRHGSTRVLLHRVGTMLERHLGHPLFLYLHIMDPHDPYTPVSPFQQMFDPPPATAVREELRPRETGFLNHQYFDRHEPLTPVEKSFLHRHYLGEIRQVDTMLHVLFRKLLHLGYLENSIIIITSDHGEEFGEHGFYQHSKSLYEEAVHVPMILYSQDEQFRGFIQAGCASTVDIPDTLCTMSGLVFPGETEGRSLYPPMNPEPRDRTVYSLLHHRERRQSAHTLWRSVYRGTQKIQWVNHDGYQCIDLDRFPGETFDVIATEFSEFKSNPALTGWLSLAEELEAFMNAEEVFSSSDSDDNRSLNHKLKQLGYIESSR
ncbi:MAG TPA: sulfatase [bacterium]|nr:sulfatase [bacterium]